MRDATTTSTGAGDPGTQSRKKVRAVKDLGSMTLRLLSDDLDNGAVFAGAPSRSNLVGCSCVCVHPRAAKEPDLASKLESAKKKVWSIETE